MRRAAQALAVVGAVLIAIPSVGGAQTPTVTVVGPTGNPLREATPRFTITTSGFSALAPPADIRLQVSFTPDFSGPMFADTVVPGAAATITIPRLLPQQASIWWRAVVRTTQNTPVISNAEGPRRTPAWLSLIFPNNLNGNTVTTARPTFQWSAAGLYPPVGPWRFTIVISHSSDGRAVLTGSLSDSAYMPPTDLESNTSYRWSVSAVSQAGDSVRLINASSFVILSASAPLATVLYQNFPNPFPNERLTSTCLWFDLKRQSDVRLEILDMRGNRVTTLIPGRGLDVSGTVPAGRYGRAAPGSDTGCDPRLSWDGTDQRGRIVPAGLYLVRFRADGVETVRKILFKGR